AAVRAGLRWVGERSSATVVYSWPFLAWGVTVEETVPGLASRPALFLLLCGRAGTTTRRPLLVAVGAAIEMGYVAAISHASVGDDETPGPGEERRDGSANWGNMFALMVGDFLLSNAYSMSANVAAG